MERRENEIEDLKRSAKRSVTGKRDLEIQKKKRERETYRGVAE